MGRDLACAGLCSHELAGSVNERTTADFELIETGSEGGAGGLLPSKDRVRRAGLFVGVVSQAKLNASTTADRGGSGGTASAVRTEEKWRVRGG